MVAQLPLDQVLEIRWQRAATAGKPEPCRLLRLATQIWVNLSTHGNAELVLVALSAEELGSDPVAVGG
ncbi:MAG: hypothetical protein ACRC0L_05665 [Angustibacter sp.]